MAFKEASPEMGEKLNTPPGIKLDWSQLSILCCPVCRDELVLFEHIDMYKCRCGFKINTSNLEKMSDLSGRNFSRGFCIGNYYDETPF